MTCNGRVRAIAGRRRRLCVLLIFGLLLGAPAAASAQQDGFTPINPTKSHKTITLTGEDMSIQDVVDIARHGAKVRISRDHQNYMNRAYNLIIEAARQEIPVYRFNRGAGAARETVIFSGDPYRPDNLANLQTRRVNAARNGAWEVEDPYRPYVESEEIVRAMMAVRANNIKYVANGPATAQKIADLLNNRITPLTQGWRSEGGFTLSNSNFNKTELSGNVEQFTIALTDTVHTIALRTLRIGQPFFSVITPGDVLGPDVLARAAPEYEGPGVLGDLVDELQVLTMPIPVEMDPNRVHPDETFTFGSEKVAKARLALDVSLRLIAQEALSATFWTDVREAQRPARSFGAVPECAWESFREVIPWQAEPGTRPPNPGEIAYEFLRENSPVECLGRLADPPRIGGKHSGKGKHHGRHDD